MPVIDDIEGWLEQDTTSEDTVDTYMQTIKRFDKVYGIHNFSESTIADFILKTLSDLKGTSKARHLYALKRVEKPLLLYGVIDEEIKWDRIPKIKQDYSKTAKALSREDVKKLLDTAYKYRDKAIIMLGYDMAMRVGEIAGLKKENLDLNNKQLYLERLKGGEKAYWTLADKTVEYLREYIKHEKPGGSEVFDIGKNRINQTIREVALEAELIQSSEKFGMHVLRHSRLSHLLIHNEWDPASVQEFAGHKTLRSTEQYLHSSPKHLEELKADADKVIL